ncbi:hypothetical protein [Thalassobacillus sp. CUG 92003]|uniref:hypothetical protein n=1 Tax=Thalassobacillus sp. CUG 92003 TaxID=2736641 RepID=UPI0015E6432A|nr:hypothetical protein [Thalassobacillus sp. CUG 92003]
MSESKKMIERGQSITFRIPSDTPDHLLKELQKLKETERRNFSSQIAQFVLQGVHDHLGKERETVTVPLPRQLTKEQRNWIKHEHSEALIGSIVHQLLMDPVRATTLLASLNSNAYDIDEALYLQEETAATQTVQQDDQVETEAASPIKTQHHDEEQASQQQDNDLDDINLASLQDDLRSHDEDENKAEDDDDLLGDFLSSMNK